jgi:hypothetical protein
MDNFFGGSLMSDYDPFEVEGSYVYGGEELEPSSMSLSLVLGFFHDLQTSVFL